MDRETAQAHALLVDDDRTIRLLLSRVLSEAGVRVTVAEDAAEAVAIAERDRTITVLVTDVQLPDRSGVGLARELAALYPSLKVVAISGDPGSLGEPGADWTVLTKPFAMDELVDAIRSAAALDSVAR